MTPFHLISRENEQTRMLARKPASKLVPTGFIHHRRICCCQNKDSASKIYCLFRREPWSSGYGKRLMFLMSWVRIPAPYTGWTFFHIIFCKICNDVFLKRPIINKKRGRGLPILEKRYFAIFKNDLLGIGQIRLDTMECTPSCIIEHSTYFFAGIKWLNLTPGSSSHTWVPGLNPIREVQSILIGYIIF